MTGRRRFITHLGALGASVALLGQRAWPRVVTVRNERGLRAAINEAIDDDVIVVGGPVTLTNSLVLPTRPSCRVTITGPGFWE